MGLAGLAFGQTITEYPIPTAASGPQAITSGPDGNLWFTEQDGNKIGRVTPGLSFTEITVPTPASHPFGITPGPDGNLWFTENFASKIGRITPAGTITELPLPTAGSGPREITTGPDGNLWFVETSGNRIGRITPSGLIVEFTIPTSNSTPQGIVAGPDGNLWFTESLGNKIGRVTTSGTITELLIPTASSFPRNITAGPDGNLWFTEQGGHKIGRVTTAGVITEFPGAGDPWGICAGSDGNLWFVEQVANKLGRITFSGTVTSYSIPTATSEPRGIASGPDGALWFTEHNANNIGRIEPPPTPLVSSIDPSSGPAVGGTPMTISGSLFADGAELTIDDAVATNIVVVSAQEIDAMTPALSPGTLNDVTVTNPDTGSGTLARGFFADFLDMPQGDIFHDYVEKIFRNGVTAGCGQGNYCRDIVVYRVSMAVFLLKAEHGSTYVPPPCTGIFGDVPCPGPFTDWVEQLSAEGITGGCGGGNYCPADKVTRAQMSAFLLKTEHGSAYTPPACAGLFDDVACPSLFADWIEALYADQVTGGCSTDPLLYCPSSFSTRGQMAVFVVKTFSLP
jgi:virginiamycin B lyase